jgi:hypothetical protein
MPSLEEFAEQQTREVFVQNQEIARKLRAVTAELGTVTAQRNSLLTDFQTMQRIYEAAVALTPTPDWLAPVDTNRTGRRMVTPLAFLSDLHAGELVRPEEMGGYNAYNLRIAEMRLKAYFEHTVELCRLWLGRHEFDGIVLVLGGDLVSGGIHDELRETDELGVLDSTFWVAERLLAGIHVFAEEFGRVHIVSVPGNHGRLSKIPRYKGRSDQNADTHIAKMVAGFGRDERITWDIPATIDAHFTVHGTGFGAVHGEEYQKNNPGTSEIGSLGPVKRGTLRTKAARAAEGKPFDVNLVAHFHQEVYAPGQGFVMNGCIKGYDEYARGLSLQPRPPEQALFLVDPEHGPTLHAPILMMDRDAEGW